MNNDAGAKIGSIHAKCPKCKTVIPGEDLPKPQPTENTQHVSIEDIVENRCPVCNEPVQLEFHEFS